MILFSHEQGVNIPSEFETANPHLKSLIAFLPDFNKESDRGMVLIASSYIDDLLQQILKAFLIEGTPSQALLEGFNAPLGTFSTRIAAATALGLITTVESEEATRIRKIRNSFAHHIHVSFDDQSLKDMSANLTMAAKDYGEVRVSPRGRFATAAVGLIVTLTNRPHYVSQQRVVAKQSWPP